MSACLLLASFSAFTPVFAQPAAAPPSSSAPSPSAPSEVPAAKARALALFEESLVCYRSGDFERAVELLQRAYGTFPEPVLLYNLGRAYEGLGDVEHAIASYERYLAVERAPPDRGAIERRLLALRRQVSLGASQPAPPATPVRRPAARLPWVVAAVGAAGAIGGGATLWLLASRRHDEAQRAVDRGAPESEYLPRQRDAERLATWTNVAWIAGGALALGGTIWGLIDRARKSPSSEHAAGRAAGAGASRVALGPDGVSLLARF